MSNGGVFKWGEGTFRDREQSSLGGEPASRTSSHPTPPKLTSKLQNCILLQQESKDLLEQTETQGRLPEQEVDPRMARYDLKEE